MRPRPYSRLPWSQWQDGRIHDIRRGTDYQVDDQAMKQQLHKRARATGWRMQAHQLEPGLIRFQFLTRLWWEGGSVESPEELRPAGRRSRDARDTE